MFQLNDGLIRLWSINEILNKASEHVDFFLSDAFYVVTAAGKRSGSANYVEALEQRAKTYSNTNPNCVALKLSCYGINASKYTIVIKVNGFTKGEQGGRGREE